MRKSVCFVLLACMISALAGCGSVPKESTLAIDKKGKITDTVVESFDKDFYDSEELQKEIESELAEYNKNFAADHITMKKFEVKDGTATLQLVFDGSEYYEDYTENTLFTGTLPEAEAEGYELSGELLDADGAKTDRASLKDADEAKVLVLETDEAMQVEVPGKILAVSAGGNVSVTGKKQAAVTDGGLSFIIYK
ncbi:hypothetical protein ACTNCH_01445 [Candidatus Merdisoma sp. HCP28S3_D10]|uniref:hypothetical protein n=1 Tax=unclassified Candidatus Merdisoma TaxID=3099611 RepID=UPI003F8916C1